MARLSREYRIYDIRNHIREIMERVNHYRLGEDDIVRIPQIPGRISKRSADYGHVYVELICKRWYDPKTKQSRNRKVTIGDVLDICKNAMIPNEKYSEYFDMETGELLRPFEDEEEPQEAGEPKENGKGKGRDVTEGERPEYADGFPSEEPATEKEAFSGDEDSNPLNEAEGPFTAEEERQKLADPRRPGTGTSAYGTDESTDEKEDDSLLSEKCREEVVESIMGTRRHFAEEARQKLEREEEEQLEQELYGDEAPESEEDLEAAEQELREAFGLEPKPKVEKTEEEKELDRQYASYQKDRERLAILKQILNGILTAIRNQARKRPNDIVNTYKVNKINEILIEIRDKYKESDYLDLLDLMEEPKIVKDEDGEISITGTTYSDAEVMLSHYDTILKFIRVDKNQKSLKTRKLDRLESISSRYDI